MNDDDGFDGIKMDNLLEFKVNLLYITHNIYNIVNFHCFRFP